MIVDVCGNEGTVNNDTKTKPKKQFQTLITHLDKEKEHVWKNAEVKLHDAECETYTLTSGDGSFKFASFIDAKQEPAVMKLRSYDSCCTIL